MKIQREHIGNYSYEVGINSVADYSPFGVELDGRTMDNVFYHSESNNNGSQTPADTVEIYNNDFDNPPATASPYYSTEVTLDAHLSNTNWTSSTGAFTNYNSSGAGSGKSIAITTASADTAYLTLTMDVDSGYELDITSYSFAHRSSATGYDSYTLIVNGIEIGSGSIYVASSGSTLQSTGVVNVNNTVSGVTGTVNVVLKLYGGTHGYSGTFRMDDFVLNGFVQEESSGNSSSDFFVSRNHRYSFQNQEHHNEIRGKGNYINYKYRGYDPRIGRLDWLVDPLSSEYPWNSPYAFSENVVINAVELEGLEKVSIYDVYNENGLTKYKLTKSYIDKDVKNGVDRSIYNYLDEKGGNIINTEEVRSWRSDRYPELNFYDSEIKSNLEEGKYWEAFKWKIRKMDNAVKGDVGEGLKLMTATAGVILSGGSMAMASGFYSFSMGASGLMFSLDDFTSIGEKESFLESSLRNAIGDDAANLLKGAKIALSVKGATKGFTNITVHLANGEFMKGSYDAGKGILEIGGAVLDVKAYNNEKESNDE